MSHTNNKENITLTNGDKFENCMKLNLIRAPKITITKGCRKTVLEVKLSVISKARVRKGR